MSELSEVVLSLLVDRVESFDKLEILLWLRRNPAQGWTVAEIATELRVPELSVERALDELAEGELVSMITESSRKRYEFAPHPVEVASAVEDLAKAYEEQRLDVMNVLSRNAIDRIRSRAAVALAEAFRFGKDDKGKKDG